MESECEMQSDGGLDALARFLEYRGEDFLYWQDGSIVVESYYDKQFRALGGDTQQLISFFGDYSTMPDAARHYLALHRNARSKLFHPE